MLSDDNNSTNLRKRRKIKRRHYIVAEMSFHIYAKDVIPTSFYAYFALSSIACGSFNPKPRC